MNNPTHLAGVTDTNNTATIATGSISPSANALLLVAFGLLGASPITLDSLATTLSNVGAWTIIQVVFDDGVASGARYNRCAIAYAQITGSPGTGTITATISANNRHKILRVAEVTGHNTGTPVAQNNTNTGNGTTLTVTLPGSPGATSMVFGAIHNEANLTGITPGTDFTEIGETSLDSTNDSMLQNQYDNGGADTTCDWSNLNTAGSAGVAIEINDAPTGTRIKDPIMSGGMTPKKR